MKASAECSSLNQIVDKSIFLIVVSWFTWLISSSTIRLRLETEQEQIMLREDERMTCSWLLLPQIQASHPLHISHPSHTHQRWVGGDWCYVSSSTVSSLATISSIVVSLLSIVSTPSSSSSPLSKHLVLVSTPLFCSQFEWIKQIKNLPRHTVSASLQTWFIYRNNKLLKYFTVLSVTVTRQNNSDLIVLIWHGFCWLSQLQNFAFLGIWMWAQTEYSRVCLQSMELFSAKNIKLQYVSPWIYSLWQALRIFRSQF